MDDKTQPQEVAAEAVSVQEISPEVKDFYERHKLALVNWAKTFPGKQLPIYVDPVDGKMQWANRAMRRRAQKKQPNKMKLYVHNYR